MRSRDLPSGSGRLPGNAGQTRCRREGVTAGMPVLSGFSKEGVMTAHPFPGCCSTMDPFELNATDNHFPADLEKRKFRNVYIHSVNFFKWFNDAITVPAFLQRRY